MVILTRRQFALAAALACVGCAAENTKNSTGAGNAAGAQAQTMFKNADKDGNGSLSQQELQGYLDTDSDGQVSFQEWMAKAGQI